MIHQQIIPTLRQQSQYLILALAIGVVLLTIQLELRPFVGPAIGVLLGGILAVVIPSDQYKVRIASRSDPIDWRINGIVTSLYVTGVLVSYHVTTWTRPTIHYVFFGAVVGYIGYQIYRGQPRSQIFIQLVIVTFVTYWSSQLAFPAGISSTDTSGILDGIRQSNEAGYIVDGIPYSNTPTQLIMIIQAVEILNLPYEITYALLATLLLVLAIPLIGILDRVFPNISPDISLYSALIFSIISFTLNRGFLPHKNNFFRAMIIIVIITVVYLIFRHENRLPWQIISLVTFTALVTGHTFSTGAAIFIILSFMLFNVLINLSNYMNLGRDDLPNTFPTIFIVGLITTLFAYSIYIGGGIVNRLGRSLLSVISFFGLVGDQVTPGGSGGGRYAEMEIQTLILSTSSEMIIFALSVFGIVIVFQRGQFDFDMILCWVIFAFGLIGFGLFVNALDIPIQRIYGLLALFGINIMIVVALVTIVHQLPISSKEIFTFGILFFISVMFLASPIAGIALSPLSDEIPHARDYETEPNNHGIEWTNSMIEQDVLTMNVPHHDLPLKSSTTQAGVTINQTELESGQLYVFNHLGVRSGVYVDSDLDLRVLGGRDIEFLGSNSALEQDNRIFTNSQYTIYEST